MAKLVLTDAFVSVATHDLSAFLRSITLTVAAKIQDATCMTDDWDKALAGCKNWKLTLEFAQDFATGSVDDLLWAALGVSTAIVMRPIQAAKGTGNPEFSGNALLDSYDPLSGKVGDLASVKPSFTGTGALGRATT